MAKTNPKRESRQARPKGPSRKSTAYRGQGPALRGKKLETAVQKFQSEPDEKKAHEEWKRIERSVFGVEFEH
jgi:hypothetical protein